MTGSSCTLAQLRLIFKMRGIAGQISPPSQNGVTAKHSGKMTLSGCLFYTSANVKWGSDIKRSHFECGAKCYREALSYWLNPVMLNVSTDRAKELQVYKLDMINVFFFNIQKDTNQLEWKGNIEYLQQFARFEESLKNIRGLTQKMKCEQEDFVGKKKHRSMVHYIVTIHPRKHRQIYWNITHHFVIFLRFTRQSAHGNFSPKRAKFVTE